MNRAAAVGVLRSLGLLKLADAVRYRTRRRRGRAANAAFRRDHPTFRLPPDELAFDAYGQVDHAGYMASGEAHAATFARIIRACDPPRPTRVLEWGCGPGRVIRHMPGLLADLDPAVTGSDYNPGSVTWCAANLPGIRFTVNDLMPPLPYPDDAFEVVYSISVFTHLSEEAQLAWAAELRRVLAPGGVLICSTHGDLCTSMLASAKERARYAAGEVVVQGKYREGRKWFLALHPEPFVRGRLLAGFDAVERVVGPTEFGWVQDVWVAWNDAPAGTTERLRAAGLLPG